MVCLRGKLWSGHSNLSLVHFPLFSCSTVCISPLATGKYLWWHLEELLPFPLCAWHSPSCLPLLFHLWPYSIFAFFGKDFSPLNSFPRYHDLLRGAQLCRLVGLLEVAVTSCVQHRASPLSTEATPAWGEQLLTAEGCSCDASSLAASGAA